MPTVETEYRLEADVSAVIDANGNATASSNANGLLGPAVSGERWEVEYQSVNGAARAQLVVYRGASNRQLDVTSTADNDTSDTKISLRSGEFLRYVWTRGTVGAVMTVHIEGSRYVRGQRAY